MDASLILPKSRLMDFIEQRLSNFMRELLRTGLIIDDPETLLDVIGDDPVALAEVSNLVREAIRQIHDIIHEVRRRWDEFADAPALVQDKVADWLDRSDVLLTPALH